MRACARCCGACASTCQTPSHRTPVIGAAPKVSDWAGRASPTPAIPPLPPRKPPQNPQTRTRTRDAARASRGRNAVAPATTNTIAVVHLARTFMPVPSTSAPCPYGAQPNKYPTAAGSLPKAAGKPSHAHTGPVTQRKRSSPPKAQSIAMARCYQKAIQVRHQEPAVAGDHGRATFRDRKSVG